ncbi:ABC transporter substrate-binding protein [Bifidobacterium lemurum]|uniref:ABC transporter substrate-binding protein n=1 Tax=Bifidobacterium lemurum TaxID=1603886 RepID=A0A261FRF0_9BIFI|nr:extracellular solute-binding protein [Bifidobacterium lemurum]OZG61760.1 ABC transporter substrate-binding protein [Bifidobacterium lemurum]QOL34916.1 extracellular solute-binding protein [Bifidobacterium lemurum]
MELKKKLTTALAAGLASAMMFSVAACGADDSSSDNAVDDGSLMTVDVFSSTANYQGMQKGWFAKIVKDKFNIELNIIAPNVAGGGDTLFDTRSAAGDLGDIVIVGTGNGRLQKLVKSGLIVDMTEYYDDMENVQNYQSAVDAVTELAGQDGVWGFPQAVSTSSPTEPNEGVEPGAAPYIRWDYYREIGYPEINDLDDFLDMLKQMQDKAREDTGEDDIYALSLFKDWDGDVMQNAQAIASWYGYGLQNSMFVAADGSDVQSAIDEGGVYEKALEFLNKAYQMGLVDPESTTQNWDTLSTKVTNGKVLVSLWSWLGKPRQNTAENKANGVGFMLAPIGDMKVYSDGFKPNGDTSSIIAIGSKAENKARLAEFIDWLYSPEGVYASASNSGGAVCPEEMCWTVNDEGLPELTEFGDKAMNDASDLTVSDEYGGGSYNDGVSALNFKTVAQNDIDPNTGEAFNQQLWTTVLNQTDALQDDWASHMGGAQTDIEYLENSGKISVAAGASYVTPEEDSQISTLRASIKTEIVNASWQAVTASSDSEFKQILDEMRTKVNDLDYASVRAVDEQNAKDLIAAREAIVKQAESESE